MSGDLSFEKKTQGSVLLLLCSGKCPHNRPSGHSFYLHLIVKSPNRTALDFKAKIKSQMSELNHNGQQKNLMQRFMSDLRELFGLVCEEL